MWSFDYLDGPTTICEGNILLGFLPLFLWGTSWKLIHLEPKVGFVLLARFALLEKYTHCTNLLIPGVLVKQACFPSFGTGPKEAVTNVLLCAELPTGKDAPTPTAGHSLLYFTLLWLMVHLGDPMNFWYSFYSLLLANISAAFWEYQQTQHAHSWHTVLASSVLSPAPPPSSTILSFARHQKFFWGNLYIYIKYSEPSKKVWPWAE